MPVPEALVWISPACGLLLGGIVHRASIRLACDPARGRRFHSRSDVCDGCGDRSLVRLVVPEVLRSRICRCGRHRGFGRTGLELGLAAGFLLLAIAADRALVRFGAPRARPDATGLLLVSWALLSTLVLNARINLRTKIYPDELTFFLIVPGLVAVACVPAIHPRPPFELGHARLDSVAAGALGCAVSAIALRFLRPWTGLGDLKWMAFLGVLLGWRGVLVTIAAAVPIWLAAGCVRRLRPRRDGLLDPSAPIWCPLALAAFLAADSIDSLLPF